MPAKKEQAELSLAQKIMDFSVAFEGIQKTRINTHLKSNFANFDDIWVAIRKPLQESGICCLFTISRIEDLKQVLMLTVSAGNEKIESSLVISPEKNTAQALGSFLTYAKRYLITTVLHITEAMGDVDDDGHEASAPPTLTTDQQNKIAIKAEELFGKDAARKVAVMVKNIYQAKDLKEVPATEYDNCVTALENHYKKVQEANQ